MVLPGADIGEQVVVAAGGGAADTCRIAAWLLACPQRSSADGSPASAGGPNGSVQSATTRGGRVRRAGQDILWAPAVRRTCRVVVLEVCDQRRAGGPGLVACLGREVVPARAASPTICSNHHRVGRNCSPERDAPATAVSLRPPVSQPSTAGIASRGRASEQLSISVTPAARRRLDRAPLDVRGLLVSTASALLLAACFLPWYLLTSVDSATGIGGQTVSILDAPFGGWRMAIPLVAAVAVVCGILDASSEPMPGRDDELHRPACPGPGRTRARGRRSGEPDAPRRSRGTRRGGEPSVARVGRARLRRRRRRRIVRGRSRQNLRPLTTAGSASNTVGPP